MSEQGKPKVSVASRRHAIAAGAVAFGSLVAGYALRADAQATDAAPCQGEAATRISLHQEVAFSGTAARIYDALMNAKQFAQLTGMSATIDPAAGGAFSTFGGMIAGRNVELVAAQRIVQAWRAQHWDAGIYSIVKFELRPQGAQTLVVLDQAGFPLGEFDALDSGWGPRYWEPLRKYLG
jgi:activator of HSP90 ATPase